MNIVQIRDRGQVTIPKKIRQKAGLDVSAMVKITSKLGKIILQPVTITPYPTRDYPKKEIEQFIRDDQLDGSVKEKADKLLAE